MADKKISDLDVLGNVDGTEFIPVEKGGLNFKLDVSDLYFPGSSNIVPVAEGGTGATTGAGAITNLGAVATTDPRLSDTRDPNAHAGEHTDGTDDIQDATAGQKGLATTTQITKLDAIEDNATIDQTDPEIKTAFDNEVPIVSQVDAEAGTATVAEQWTPERVKQAIDALGGGGGGGGHIITEDTVASTARANLDFDGTAFNVTDNVGDSATDITIVFDTGSGTSCEGNDARLSDARTPTTHSIAGSEHSADTLANLNTKVSDATLIDTGDSRLSDARTPTSHAIAGTEHSASTLAQLNGKVSDATLIDTGDSRLSDARTPTSHSIAGGEHGADTLANLNGKISDATLIDTGDSRLSDSRAPTNHASDHTDGTDDIAEFIGDSGSGGTKGLVKEPVTGDATKFLKGDGTWATVSGATLSPWTIKTANYTAVSGDRIQANTQGGVFTITLPASPGVDDTVEIMDYSKTFAGNNLTVARNGSNIENLAEDQTVGIQGFRKEYVFTTARGWIL